MPEYWLSKFLGLFDDKSFSFMLSCSTCPSFGERLDFLKIAFAILETFFYDHMCQNSKLYQSMTFQLHLFIFESMVIFGSLDFGH